MGETRVIEWMQVGGKRFSADTYRGNNGSASPPPADDRSSPGKELPTRILKQERARDRQAVTSALDTDRDYTERLNNVKKCASTQTQFSSFMGESTEPPPPPPYYTTHDTIPHDTIVSGQHHHLNNHTYPHPPPPLHSFYSQAHATTTISSTEHTHPSQHPHANGSRDAAHPSSSTSSSTSPASYFPLPLSSHPQQASPYTDVQHAPLNLSLSNTTTTSKPINGARQSPATNSRTPNTSSGYQQRHASVEHSFNSPMSQEDESIEEHFRRSLGKCYPEQPTPTGSVSPPPPPAQAPAVAKAAASPINPVSLQSAGEKICSVDDHFARALGDQMWTEIKARSEVVPLDGLTDTVDAHFAKALGANMWKKLKAENKVVEDGTQQKHKHPKQQQKPGLPHGGSTATTSPHPSVPAPIVT
ncbi:transcription cofactor vestigial-like protein 4 [Plakobranchus ocellatus]|uniref:Transcription cofactor vestigial-like protein 4 n=1 Tax=Plakobranchus ocellatus TaxID=259542 RepID=A0AAV4AKD1_9GAST|nr:transcription cofactor vestigial-like protein 4 [Plakobranchus ocellatus]